MVEPVHVKLNSEEAVYSKRKLLSTEINFLNMVKRIQSFGKYRKAELTAKTALKRKMKELREEMTELKRLLPKSHMPEVEKKEIEKESFEKTKKIKLEDELRDIKEKLARLS
jgi:hypothetical protein